MQCLVCKGHAPARYTLPLAELVGEATSASSGNGASMRARAIRWRSAGYTSIRSRATGQGTTGAEGDDRASGSTKCSESSEHADMIASGMDACLRACRNKDQRAMRPTCSLTLAAAAIGSVDLACKKAHKSVVIHCETPTACTTSRQRTVMSLGSGSWRFTMRFTASGRWAPLSAQWRPMLSTRRKGARSPVA